MSELEKYLCTECGGELQLDADRRRGVCKYCHNEYFFKEEKGPALVLALNNANGYLRRNDFDNAIVHYESILKEYPKDAEAAWGHTLSTYGIVYAKDDRTGQMIPTCSRIVKESILENRSYRLAIRECAEEQRAIYEQKAAFIDRIQKKIKRAMEDEEDFDVFISFKAKDANGIATEDSVIARNIYNELRKSGIKTFFSEVTLRNRFGDEFEPVIYRALYSCKFFILVATKDEYIEAPWVKNEWTRFRDRVTDEGLSGACSAVFKNVSPYSLPRIFQTQGIELEKHPFDYAQLVADNLSNKFGLSNREKELERKNAELEEKLKKLEEAQKNTSTAASGAIDKDALASMMRQIEEDKKRAEEEAKRKAEEAKRKAEEAKRKAAEEAKRKAEEAKRKAAEEAKYRAECDIEDGRLKRYTGNSPNVVIPDSVTSIGDRAFCFCCRSLTSVTIPNSVTSIGEDAFRDCYSLTSVTIGNSVTIIGSDAFYDCDSLTSVTIGNSVTSIGDSAFYGCKLTSITIPDSVTSIGDRAFMYCSSLTSVTIPDSVTSIGDGAFSGCSSLESITVSEGNISYKSIDGNLYTKDGKTLVQYAVGKADSSFVISNSVTSIGEDAFCRCSSLTSITIPDSVTSIGSSAFFGCSSLTSVTIPDSVTSIGGGAFEGCASLTSVTIPNSVTSIGDRAFLGCGSLTSVTIPDSVTSIGDYAFSGCRSLISVTIPDSVTSIGDYAFPGCSSLISVTIPDSVTRIGMAAFSGCRSLTSVTIPDSVTSIGEDAFNGCNQLYRIYVSNSENINMWYKRWNPYNRPVFDAKTGKQLKKNIFGKQK